jgi:ABC-type multidrug transport system fused ATPase/permease subunit
MVKDAMRELPEPDAGEPDHRSATRCLWWLARRQWRTVTLGVVMGSVWMVSQALMPAVIGRAIQGVSDLDSAAVLGWTGALAALGVLQAGAGVLRHRLAVFNYLAAAYRTVQVTVRQAGRLGATLGRRLASGEVISVGTSDVEAIGNSIDVTARGTGAVVAIVAVAVILLASSLPLGLTVVLGVPELLTIVAVLIRPLHARQQAYRDATAALTTRAADIVTGLRVLRGIGGEQTFATRYRSESQRVRAAGVRVAGVESVMEAMQVLLPGLFVAFVAWLGARFAVAGDITIGQLLAFYGYAVFLVFPLRTLTEVADTMTRGYVAARRVTRILALDHDLADPTAPVAAPDPTRSNLVDPDSGVVIRPGQLTAIAADRPEDAAAIAGRLGRLADGAASLDAVPLAAMDLATVRELILVADNEARIFSGRLADELSGARVVDAERVRSTLRTASAEDVVDALPRGLDTVVAERGRDFSGGQQQRLRLARALLVDAPVLILVEPTSAVDAHTEARIGERLGPARSGRTTVVCSTSPLLLDRADNVIYVAGGRVAAQGSHRDLLDTSQGYAATVTREEDT